MIFLEVIWVVAMFLWLMTTIPWQSASLFPWAHPLSGWISVLLLGIIIFMPALR